MKPSWSTPLHESWTTVRTAGSGRRQVLSRFADHMDSSPTPWVRAKSLTTSASAIVKTSPATSFCPIIGVMPTRPQAAVSSSVRPDCAKAACTCPCNAVLRR